MLLLIVSCAEVCGAALPPDLSRWIEVPMPSTAGKERDVWLAAANWSAHEWQVTGRDRGVVATAKPRPGAVLPAKVEFMHHLARFGRVDAYTIVKDGWLIAVNRGGSDAGLYWFNTDGARHEKISGHHVGGFFMLASGMHAIEGSTADGQHGGSVIRVARDAKGRWQTTRLTQLPNTPETVAMKSDGSVLITLSDGVVMLDAGGRLRGVLANAPWPTLFPNSSALSADQRLLYIGMRQYVAALDLATKHVRFLAPGREFVHRLTAEQEAGMRGTVMFKVVRAGKTMTLRIPPVKPGKGPTPIGALGTGGGAIGDER